MNQPEHASEPPTRPAAPGSAGPGPHPAPARSNPKTQPVGAARSASGSASDEPTRVSAGPVATPAHADGTREIARIEGYELHEEIHRGGQGIVYRATQLGTKQQVALKVLLEGPFAAEATRRRFEREVELAASLRHPNIVTILDSGVSHGRYFFAMEFIDGLRLDRYLEHERPTLPETLELLEQICNAVNFAHQRGVIHRDLKPSNILVDKDGQARVLDFGLAKPTQQVDGDESTLQMLSTTGQLLGTLGYMSPEQASGSQDVDVRSDVYSLGVIAYEALLGQPPYLVSGALGEVLSRIANEEPAPPRAVRDSSRFGRAINDELETIVLKALEKEPIRRYQTAFNLGRDFRHFLNGEPIEAKRASGLYVFKKTLRRYRIQATAAALVFALVVTSVILLAFAYTDAVAAHEKAEQARQAADVLRAVAQEQEGIARKQEGIARDAEARARLAQEQETIHAREARNAAARARRALLRQKVQRGDLARAQGDLSEARDSYWDAYFTQQDETPTAAALWPLRQYYADSGDTGASLLYLQRFGPTALSPEGRLAAFCDAPLSISIRDLETGETIGWLRAPRKLTMLQIDETGRVLAVGKGWARLWLPGAAKAAAAIELPPNFTPASIGLTADHKWILITGHLAGVAPARLYTWDADDGAFRFLLTLEGPLSAAPDYSATHNRLLAATERGVQLIEISPDGAPSELHVWPLADRGARDVQFIGDDSIAVLTDRGVELAHNPGGQFSPLRISLALADSWDTFEIRNDGRFVVLSGRDGRIAVYVDGELEKAWRTTLGTLEHVRLRSDFSHIVTLDGRGAVTQWGPRGTDRRRTTVINRLAADWTASADGSTVLLATADNRVSMYRPARSPTPTLLPRARARLSRIGASVKLAISGDGSFAIARLGDGLQFLDLESGTARESRWIARGNVPPLETVAISHDAGMIAFFARSPPSAAGERQRISFHAPDLRNRPRSRRVALNALCLLACPPIDVGGSPVRRMAFVPHSDKLLVTRANGELLMLQHPAAAPPRRRSPALAPVAAPEAWAVLDSPAYLVAFDRSGGLLALACEDGVIRLLATSDASRTGRISVGQPMTALSFNAAADVLLVRTLDDAVTLYDTDTNEPITRAWLADVQSGGSFGAARAPRRDDAAGGRAPASVLFGQQNPQPAAWIGESDAMLLGYQGRIYAHTYSDTDKLIAANEPYARQRAILRSVDREDYDEAWRLSETLQDLKPLLARSMQVALLDAVLRRPGADAPSDWLEPVLADAPARVYLRLGHAAYDAGRFDLARQWLTHGRTLAGEDTDAYTLWRIAACLYLDREMGPAAEILARLPDRADLDPLDIPEVQLQLASALLLDGRREEAGIVADRIGKHTRTRARSEALATASAQAIGHYMFEIGGAGLIADLFDTLMGQFKDEALLYRDDIHFFEGELALQRGDIGEAALRFQRCIDIARDTWPSNWARHRLAALNRGTQ